MLRKDGKRFFISVNRFCKVQDFLENYPPLKPESGDRQPSRSGWTPDAILSHGGLCVVGALGKFLAEPLWDKDGIVYAELKRGGVDHMGKYL